MLRRSVESKVVSGLSCTQRAVQAVADFIVASERCKTVRQAVVANIICKNSMSESTRLIGELVANFIVGPQKIRETCRAIAGRSALAASTWH